MNENGLRLSENALIVLERRYLLRDENGVVVETPEQLFRRVARAIAQVDVSYEGEAEAGRTEEDFFRMMSSLAFLPNSPTLMNAGRKLGQLSACFVLPVDDSLESIFDAVKHTAIIHKSGGGTGFSFSRLRPRNDQVESSHGVSSGPVSFMRVFDMATDTIKQGGTRRGANMGILRVDHPDIEEFIHCKAGGEQFTNFNISVGVTDAFMDAVEKDGEFDLVNPRTGRAVKRVKAKPLFDSITEAAWKNGDPGILFLDAINRSNPTPLAGDIESTNPCGEQPLLPYESCNLGSIDLAALVRDGGIDFGGLKRLVWTAVHFLDNVVDANKFPLERIRAMTRANRKIGLGVMGFADMLIRLNVPYNSEEAVARAEEIMRFIRRESREASAELARWRGNFPNYPGSVYDTPETPFMRNATTTTVAPTGTLSIIAGVSGGIEPIFALAYVRKVLDGKRLIEVHPEFKHRAEAEGFLSDDLMKWIARTGSVQTREDVPAHIRRVFVTAHDIGPEWHIRMQAAFQKHTDNAVSKTINFPADATVEDVRRVYLEAYRAGVKGITIYRYGSRDTQVLNLGSDREDGQTPPVHGPTPCTRPFYPEEQFSEETTCPA